jgi:hypothetical protein
MDTKTERIKPPRPDARRELTDAAFKEIASSETIARREKTQKLRHARMAAADGERGSK